MQAAAASGYRGIQVGPFPAKALATEKARLTDLASELGLRGAEICLEEIPSEPGTSTLRLFLPAELQRRWSPNFDTLGLYDRLDEDLGPLSSEAGTPSSTVIRREALVAMMVSPVDHPFPNSDELCSALRMRAYISSAAARTALDFHTVKVNRPMSHWNFDADRGFTLRQGCDLIRALRLTTQPDASGELYAFSCYRATEYVLLLGMAEELQNSHPALLRALEAQWQQAAIASGRFHDTFLHELGSNEQPLPMRYYVPGDRVCSATLTKCLLMLPAMRAPGRCTWDGVCLPTCGNGINPSRWRANAWRSTTGATPFTTMPRANRASMKRWWQAALPRPTATRSNGKPSSSACCACATSRAFMPKADASTGLAKAHAGAGRIHRYSPEAHSAAGGRGRTSAEGDCSLEG